MNIAMLLEAWSAMGANKLHFFDYAWYGDRCGRSYLDVIHR